MVGYKPELIPIAALKATVEVHSLFVYSLYSMS